MYVPPPIEIPRGTVPESVAKAIRLALLGRGWSVDKENLAGSGGTSEIVSTLNIRVHSLTIRIEFDEKQIQMHYATSTNLGYMETTKNEKFIHPSCATWLKNLESDIKIEFTKMKS